MIQRRRPAAATVIGSLLLGTMLAAGFGGVANADSRTAVRGTQPSWANSQNVIRQANPKQSVTFRLYLGWRNASAATALARAVSDPHSASYRHFLTPTQFRKQFSPTPGDVGAVKNWLHASGLAVGYTPANRHYISVKGTVAQIETAFGTTLNVYRVAGKELRAPAGDIALPASIAGLVSGSVGLDQSNALVQADNRVDRKAPPTSGFNNSPPCSSFWAELLSPYAFPAGFTDVAGTVPWAPCGYTPAQIKGAYGIGSTYDGSGQTVAIIDAYASPTILSDVNQWSGNRGLPTMTPGQFVQVVPPGVYRRPENRAQDPQGWYGEETLDVEAVHGMAPGARIVYVGAPNNYRDLDAAMNHVVDRHLGQIVTNSYGFPTELLPRGFIIPQEQTYIQGAIEGIGIYFSSGDSGDESSRFGFATPDWPASSPWVTAVGGTSLGVSNAESRALETGWGTSTYACDTTTLACSRLGWLYGAGGGVSRLFPQPSYQAGVVTATGRAVPDIGAIADPQTGLRIGQTQTFPNGTYYGEYRIGGTSLASPIMAGIMALADQRAGHPHGFANPLFYAHPSAFYDVTSVKTAVARRNFNNGFDGSLGTSDFLRTFDDYSGSPSQHTNPGWDNVTGLGTPGSAFLSIIGR